MEKLFANENKFDEVIANVSTATGVPVSVIKGFVALESNFDANAYKEEPHINDASYGLMQVLDKTARGVGFQGLPKDLFAPANSVYYGSAFLKKLLAKYPNIMDAIAAYNMGHPRKAKDTTAIIKGIYGEPQPDWIYANQPYVDRVAAYIAYYQTFDAPPNEEARAKILDALKKKDRGTLRNLSGQLVEVGGTLQFHLSLSPSSPQS